VLRLFNGIATWSTTLARVSQHDSIVLSCPVSVKRTVCDGNCLPKKDKLCPYVRLCTCPTIMSEADFGAVGHPIGESVIWTCFSLFLFVLYRQKLTDVTL
jgi:hypothetical protein